MLRTHVADAIQKAGEKSATQLTRDVRLQALDAGWTTAAAGRVNVHHTGGRFTASFAGAEDFEYGTEATPPRPVAREFEMNAHQGRADHIFATHLLHELRHLL